MKTIRKISILALPIALLALASCTAEDGDPTSGQTLPEGAVRIIATINSTTAPDGIAAPEPATRATLAPDGSGTFAPGDVWGMYTRLADGTAINNNLAFAYGTTTLYWDELSKTDPVTFAAHYPRQTDADEGTNTPTAYPFEMAAGSSPADSDLLFATATASKGGEVALGFHHLMHRLVVSLTKGDGVAGNLADARISLLDMKTKVPVDLLAGTVDAANASAGADYPEAAGATSYCITVPQDLTPGADWIKITLEGNTYIYKVPATLKPAATTPADPHPTRLESGRQLTLNLRLKRDKVELASSAISAWGDQGTVDGDADMDKTKRVATLAELKAAIAAVPDGAGSADAPAATIRLTADITMGDNDLGIGAYNSTGGTDIQHIRIDGGGHTLKHSAANTDAVILAVYPNSSLTLTNITLDGDGRATNTLLYIIDDATAILDNGATLTNTADSDNATAVFINRRGLLRLKPGSAITDIPATDAWSIRAAIQVARKATVSFEGGTLEGNGADVMMQHYDGEDAPLLKVQAWPKPKPGGGREALTIKYHYRNSNLADPYANPVLVAEGDNSSLTPALAPEDFSLVSAWGDDNFGQLIIVYPATLGFYLDPNLPAVGTSHIYLQKKP